MTSLLISTDAHILPALAMMMEDYIFVGELLLDVTDTAAATLGSSVVDTDAGHH